MNTAFMLMAQYNGRAIIPIDQVCTDYFTHLTPDMFQRKVLAGQIKLPITRLETSQKSGNRSINPVLADGFFQEAEAEAGELFHGSSAS